MFSSLRLERNILDARRYYAALHKNIIAVTTSAKLTSYTADVFFFFIPVFLKHFHSIPNQTKDKFFSVTEATASQIHLQFLLLNLP